MNSKDVTGALARSSECAVCNSENVSAGGAAWLQHGIPHLSVNLAFFLGESSKNRSAAGDDWSSKPIKLAQNRSDGTF